MSNYVRGYMYDAGVDIVLDKPMVIQPGFNNLELSAKYTPAVGEVAFLVSRSSTATKGIFPIMVAIDADYNGTLSAFVVNATNNTYTFEPGDRVFGIVNLKLGEDRVEFQVAKLGSRGSNKLASSGGQNNE